MAFGGWGEDSEEGQSFALNEHQKKDLGLPLRPEDPELLKTVWEAAPDDLLPRRWTHAA